MPVTFRIAWYRREQWELLRAIAADPDYLEPTYEEWLQVATERTREMKARGVEVEKIDVEVNALVRWCERKGKPVDAGARSEYAGLGLGPTIPDGPILD